MPHMVLIGLFVLCVLERPFHLSIFIRVVPITLYVCRLIRNLSLILLKVVFSFFERVGSVFSAR